MALSEKLKQLNVTIPPANPFGAYVPAKRVGNLIYVAGQLPRRDGKLMATGPVPSQCSMDLAREAAKQCVINALAAVATLGNGVVDSLVGVVRVGAFVASDNSFTEQPKVADAASEFLKELFGDPGQHVRAAVGTNVLPLGASVEIEFIFECR
jgi:enamine deaminase RidA (YjgF/YER057c/UK114 family)